MLHSLATVTVFGLLSLAVALPAAPDIPNVVIPASALNNGSATSTCQVLVCTDPNYGGLCAQVTSGEAQCVAASQIRPEFVNTVSTFVIQDGCVCSLTDNPSCWRTNGNWISLAPPGLEDLRTWTYDNLMQGYICNH